MSYLCDKKLCAGCTACAARCPRKAITMKVNEEGFLFPEINENTCIKCGLCQKVCPVINKTDIDRSFYAVAVQNKDDNIREDSSSGGVFNAFAERIIDSGGVVFGAAFSEDFKSVNHIEVSKKEDLYKLRGSKYLQSNMLNTYEQAEEYLKKGKTVYFSGTPCQIAGLYAYLGKEYDNLYTQDLICHGVPSPSVWGKYVSFREKKAASKVSGAFFRNKESGWKLFSIQLKYQNCTEYINPIKKDLYMQGFLANLFLRPSCYNCSFKTYNRLADITLADFWGVEKVLPEMDDDMGTSLVILHSKKAQMLFECCSENFNFKKTDAHTAVKYNLAMIKSVKLHPNRRKFFNSLEKCEFDKCITMCLKIPLHIRMYEALIIKTKRIMKKVLGR